MQFNNKIYLGWCIYVLYINLYFPLHSLAHFYNGLEQRVNPRRDGTRSWTGLNRLF